VSKIPLLYEPAASVARPLGCARPYQQREWEFLATVSSLPTYISLQRQPFWIGLFVLNPPFSELQRELKHAEWFVTQSYKNEVKVGER
jgi:hypothetical protein